MFTSPKLAAFLDAHSLGVLATTAADGRPRQSLVFFARRDERVLISTEAGRWKARDVRRTGWASLAVRGDEAPYPSVTLAGPEYLVDENVALLTALVAQRVVGLDEPPRRRQSRRLQMPAGCSDDRRRARRASELHRA